MKTTTFAVLLANMWATFRRREDAEFFGRRIDGSAVKNAATIAGMYLTLFFLGAFVIATAEQLPMSVCLYETASAVATVIHSEHASHERLPHAGNQLDGLSRLQTADHADHRAQYAASITRLSWCLGGR